MAHREFIDADGVEWQVWEVIPSTAERRGSGERRFGTRAAGERRTQQQLRVRMEEGLADGWLVFECATEKRRLLPVPQGWSELSDDALAALGRSAVVAPRMSRD